MIVAGLKIYIFDPNCDTYLSTDASNVGLGAVLSQVQAGKEVTICFAAHTLTQQERNYLTGERGALAAVWACEYFEKFLLGRCFTLRMDHSALQQLLASPGKDQRKSSKFVQWAERLTAFDFKPVYHQGSENLVADALSCLPAPFVGSASDDPGEEVILK